MENCKSLFKQNYAPWCKARRLLQTLNHPAVFPKATEDTWQFKIAQPTLQNSRPNTAEDDAVLQNSIKTTDEHSKHSTRTSKLILNTSTCLYYGAGTSFLQTWQDVPHLEVHPTSSLWREPAHSADEKFSLTRHKGQLKRKQHIRTFQCNLPKKCHLWKLLRKPQDLSSGDFLNPGWNFWSKPETTMIDQPFCWARGGKANDYLGVAFGVDECQPFCWTRGGKPMTIWSGRVSTPW